jgi:hypothetical protein
MSRLQVKYRVLMQNEVKYHLANVLLLSGEGRNVGKTTLGCRIIERLSGDTKVIALKVSPHFHTLTGSLVSLKDSDSLTIARETDKNSGKDSSRYLNAGASEVYYIQCNEDSLAVLASWINENISQNTPVICESGGLIRTIQPGYAVHIRNGIGRSEQPSRPYSETIYNNNHPESVDMNIYWQNNTWQK